MQTPTATATREALYGPSQHQAPAPKPAPAAAPSQPKTQPVTVGALLAEITSLRGDVATVHAQLEAVSQALAQLLATPRAAAPVAAPSQPSQAQPTVPGTFRDFTMTAVKVGISEINGERTYKAIGQPFTKYGVRIWPEVLPELGIAAGESLKFGDNPCASRLVRAEMGDRGPKKITGLAPAPAPTAAAEDEVPF